MQGAIYGGVPNKKALSEMSAFFFRFNISSWFTSLHDILLPIAFSSNAGSEQSVWTHYRAFAAHIHNGRM